MGTIEDDAIGSSRHETIWGSASSKVFLSSVTAVCCEENLAAVSAASGSSSSAKLEPYPTVYVRQEFPYRFMRASKSPESTPPLSSKPRGTSLSRCLFIACLYSSSNSSLAASSDFIGTNG